jgi:putative isomerase
MLERWTRLLEQHIRANCGQMTREPSGQLTHPYIVPSSPHSPYYSGALWDWDSWAASIALGQVETDMRQPGLFAAHEQGSILNFLDHTDDDGVMPIQLTPDTALTHGDPTRAGGFAENMHKPVIAQHAALLTQRPGNAGLESTDLESTGLENTDPESTGPENTDLESTNIESTDWIRPHIAVIGRFIDRYLESHVHAGTGLAYWQTDFAVGVDNDPSVFYRPDKSTASVFLNSLLYRELLAYGYLLERLGDLPEAMRRRRQAHDLADAMHAHLWDERDGTFYSADLALRPVDPGDWLHRGAPRTWSSLLLRIDGWSSFLPMWAGLASQEQAGRMLERACDPRTFQAQYGIRSLSRLEKMYDLHPSNNPSNWLGPVWGMTNYMVFRGLVKYGFDDEARELAARTIRLFGHDLETSGALHEFYHPANGAPIMTRGFQNWNFLVLNMIAWLENRPVITEF